jgi:hypothetical protein
MKKMMLGAALAAVLAAPGLANAETNGSLSLGFESNDFDYGEFDGYSLGGAVWHAMDGWTIQGDGRTTLQDWDGSSGNDSHGYAAVHGSTDMSGWDVGGFVGLINYYGEGGIMLGLETRTSFGNFSLDGALAHTNFDDNGYEGTSVNVGGAYFFMPNFSVNGAIGRTDIDTDFGTDYEITEYTLGGAYQFAHNIALNGGFTSTDGDRSTGTEYDGDTIKLGVTLNFGAGTLQDNTNDGAWGSATRVADTWMRW